MDIKEIYKIIQYFEIEKEFLYLVKHNQSNFLPYHNFGHTLSVFDAVYNISKACCPKLDFNDLQYLLIAALFHDMNHSGGKYKDNVNVELAICHLENMEYDEKKESRIKKLIYATKYPYIKNYVIDENCDYVNIMRDADLVQSARLDFVQYVVGLGSEHNVSPDNFHILLTNTINFNLDNPFELAETRKLYQKERDANIELLKLMLIDLKKY